MVDEDTEVINYLLILFFRFPLSQVLKKTAHISQTTKTCTENSASKKRVSVHTLLHVQGLGRPLIQSVYFTLPRWAWKAVFP